MSVSPSYRAYVLEQLQVIGTVTAKTMFGGVGLYRESLFFGLIADDTLYLKVDDDNRGDYERMGAAPFRPYGEQSYSMQYYECPAEILEDRSELRGWAEKAVAAARRKATRGRKRPRG